jgi:hypothetical protein
MGSVFILGVPLLAPRTHKCSSVLRLVPIPLDPEQIENIARVCVLASVPPQASVSTGSLGCVRTRLMNSRYTCGVKIPYILGHVPGCIPVTVKHTCIRASTG